MNINDKLEKLKEILEVDGVSGYLVRGGIVLDKTKCDTTFSKSFVLN